MTEPTIPKQRSAPTKRKTNTPATGADAVVGFDLPKALEDQQAEAQPSLQDQDNTLTLNTSNEGGRMEPAAETRSDDLARMIAEAAYYRAERRGFAPGYEIEDWISAEIELNARLNDEDKGASVGIGG
ncbi:MAG TPA: DUF2934 domain-containing protein [Burkholderiales bacterium]|nr:DUF2934 domain-containing protein [Burkholderiales bacterium]